MQTATRSRRATVGLVLAPLIAVAIYAAPLGLEQPAHRLAGLFAAIVILWVTEALPIAATALLIAPLLVLLGVAEPKVAFASYADPLLFLFVGGFFIALAMARHGLDRRFASWLMDLAPFRGRSARARTALMIAAALLSAWVSNTATTAILIPIALGLGQRASGGHPAVAGTVLAVAYASSIGGLATPVGSPPNLIVMRYLEQGGVQVGFVTWMAIGVPAAALVCLVAHAFLGRALPVTATPSAAVATGGAPGDGASPHDAPMTRGERATLWAFSLAVVGWVVPGVLAAAGLELGTNLERVLPAGAVALFASAVLFVARDDSGEIVLPWREATKIDWGVILLFGGGIALGEQLFQTGLAAVLARAFVAWSGVEGLWPLTAAAIVITIYFTEVCSNTASANMLAPLVLAVATDLGVPPGPPLLGVGLAASLAFMLPISTGPNAIAYGTGLVSLPMMMRTGALLNVLCAVMLFLLLRVMCPLLGLS